jgi:hypothetical protein
MFFQDVGCLSMDYMALHPRKQNSPKIKYFQAYGACEHFFKDRSMGTFWRFEFMVRVSVKIKNMSNSKPDWTICMYH